MHVKILFKYHITAVVYYVPYLIANFAQLKVQINVIFVKLVIFWIAYRKLSVFQNQKVITQSLFVLLQFVNAYVQVIILLLQIIPLVVNVWLKIVFSVQLMILTNVMSASQTLFIIAH